MRDGLLGNFINAVAVDNNNLWVGTENGLNHLNLSTEIWTSYDTNNSMLPDNRVYSLAIAEDGSLWIGGSDTGIIHFNPANANNEWQFFTSDNSILYSVARGAIAIDSTNNIWFGSSSINRLDPDTNEWQNFNSANSGLSPGSIKDIIIDDANSLWIGTSLSSGIDHFNPESGIWALVSPDNSTSNYLRIQDLDLSVNGHIWGATDNGITQYDPILDTWQVFTTANSGLVYDNVRSVTTHDNDIWIGTSGYGINQYNQLSSNWKLLTTNDSSVSSNGMTGSSIIDLAGNLWIGTWNRGVSRYSPRLGEWRTFSTSNSGLGNDQVIDIAMNNNGELWFATNNGLSLYNQATDQWQIHTGLPITNPISLEIDVTGHLWIGTSANGLAYYNPENGSISTIDCNNTCPATTHVREIVTDNNGKLWFGTTNGLIYHDPENGTWQTYTTENSGIASNSASHIVIDKNNNLWIGDIGLSIFNPETNKWQTFTTENSDIPDNGIYALAIDQNGHIWIGQDALFEDNSLIRYDPINNTWLNITGSEIGLDYPIINLLANDSVGNLWVGSWGISKIEIPLLQSELALRLDGATLQVPAGTITYTTTAVNSGQSDAPTTLTITLPAELTIINSNPPIGNLSPLVWDLGTLAANGSQQTVTITAALPPDAIPGTTYTAVATATTTVPEEFLSNNVAQLTTLVLDPYRADVRVSLAGPPLLVPGNTAVYDIWLDNIGGLDATNTQLDLILPPELSLETAVPAPTLSNPPIWQLDTLNAFTPPIHFVITTTVDANVPTGTELSITAVITTTTAESDLSNNTAVATVPTTLTDARTLILVAPARLSSRFGASPLLDRLYDVADHPLVNGVVLDVMRDGNVAAAYAAWDNDPASWQAANTVAIGIKALIDEFTIAYPNLRYLLIVGGDDIIPFYRVADQNGTSWHERSYASYVAPGTVHSALAANKLLTDDFYADRTPTVPDSSFWLDGHPLYLPDFANGRLVETPTEIISAIDAFLANDGTLTLNSNLVGALPTLTNDLGDAQCSLFQQDNMTAYCPASQPSFAEEALSTPYDGLWSAPHANHLSIGYLTATDIASSSLSYSQSMLTSIGCHAGLNVNESASSSLPTLDLAQVFLGQGGTYIASSAYTYASYLSTGYSEALALSLTEQLLKGSQQSLGLALMRAKQTYFSSRADWFDYTDEKVVLPMTLYGFPMLQIITPDSMLASQTNLLEEMATVSTNAIASTSASTETAVSYTFTNLQSTFNSTAEGSYFDFQGETIAQEGTPVQPYFQSPLPNTLNGQTVRGLILRSATYNSYDSFDPVIAQSWAIEVGAAAKLTERDFLFEGWDRPMPFELGQFDGLDHNISSHTQQEMLFHSFQFEVTYSDSADTTPPTLLSAISTTDANPTLIVTATDNDTVDEVVVICDDGQGKWQTISLQQQENSWVGTCNSGSSPITIQLIDVAGNVTQSLWMSTTQTVFLPLIMHNPK